MILSFINIRKVLREVLITEGFALGYQHFPRDLANVNKPSVINTSLRTLRMLMNDNIMFDRY